MVSPESKPGGFNEMRFMFSGEPSVEGVTPKLLVNFHDIVRKWGKVDPDGQLVIFESGDIDLEFEMCLAIRLDIEQRLFMMISKGSKVISPIVVSMQNGDVVLWDRNLSSKEAAEAIMRIDKIAQANGLIDEETGERIAFGEEDSVQRQDVFPRLSAKVFRRRKGTIMRVRDEKDPEEVLKRIHENELLMIYNHILFGPVICLKGDRDYIKFCDDIVKKTLVEMGININDKEKLTQISKSQKEMQDIECLVNETLQWLNSN